jgi:hypothetical protein
LDENYRPDVFWTSARVHVYPHRRGFTHGRVKTIRGRGKNPSARTGHVRADARVRSHGRNPAFARTWRVCMDALIPSLPSPLPWGRSLLSARTRTLEIKIKIKSFSFSFFNFLVVVAGLKRKKKNSVFGFQSPRSPNSAGFAGEVARRIRFFRPSSPSRPSKLYSSLGWLNSKIPKPFSPFSL